MKKQTKSNITTIICIILLLALGFTFSYNRFFKTNSKEAKKTVEEVKEEHYEATVIAVGDNLIHSSVYKDANRYANGGYVNLSTGAFDFKHMYTEITDIVSKYDIAYFNQETILGGTELGLSDYPRFNSPYQAGGDMIDSGFNLVSLATNHTVDFGKSAVENSCKYWNEIKDVLTSGSYCSPEERDEIRIKEVNNIKYTMLNYTYGTNGLPVSDYYLVNVWPTDGSGPDNDYNYNAYKETVKQDIERVRDKVDVLIVAMHWGVEYTHNPTEYEVDMAKYLASLGVDVIIGTHPHVIQPVAWIDDTLVIYSLGNFISAQYQNYSSCTYYKCTVGLMTSFTISKDVKDGKTTVNIKNVENELIYNYYNQNTWRDFKVIPFSNPDIANYLPGYKNVYNTYKDVVQRLDGSISVVPVAE